VEAAAKLACAVNYRKEIMKKPMINGVQLTDLEWFLVDLGDVQDTNELRDIDAIRTRLQTAGFAKRHQWENRNLQGRFRLITLEQSSYGTMIQVLVSEWYQLLLNPRSRNASNRRTSPIWGTLVPQILRQP
jgi:hypothetical protein